MNETLNYDHFKINHKENVNENVHLLEFFNNQVYIKNKIFIFHFQDIDN